MCGSMCGNMLCVFAEVWEGRRREREREREREAERQRRGRGGGGRAAESNQRQGDTGRLGHRKVADAERGCEEARLRNHEWLGAVHAVEDRLQVASEVGGRGGIGARVDAIHEHTRRARRRRVSAAAWREWTRLGRGQDPCPCTGPGRSPARGGTFRLQRGQCGQRFQSALRACSITRLDHRLAALAALAPPCRRAADQGQVHTESKHTTWLLARCAWKGLWHVLGVEVREDKRGRALGFDGSVPVMKNTADGVHHGIMKAVRITVFQAVHNKERCASRTLRWQSRRRRPRATGRTAAGTC